MAKRKTVWEDCDILVVGGGMAGTGGTIKDSGTANATITQLAAIGTAAGSITVVA